MDARDEFFHVPGTDEHWSESHYLDVVGDTVQVHARLGFYPNQDVANVFAYVIDGETIYGIRDESIDPATVHGTTVDATGLRFELVPGSVGEAWRVRFAGTATRSASASAVVAGEGDPVDIDCEFVSRATHEPFLYSDGTVWPGDQGVDRYEVATQVEGEVTIDGDEGRSTAFEGPGERDHSWGPRDWTSGEWLWISGGFADGTAYNHLSAWPTGAGSVDPPVVNGFWFDGEVVHPITDATVSATPPFSAETAQAWVQDNPPTITLELEWADGSATVDVEPFATTPVDWIDSAADQRGLLNRSPALHQRDGTVSGRGFLENMTQLSLD